MGLPDTEQILDRAASRVYVNAASVSGGRSLLFEYLEPRTLLSAVLKNGLLSVRGTSGHDQISIRASAGVLTVQLNNSKLRAGSETTFRLSRVQRIKVEGLAGHDKIDARRIAGLPSTLMGGAGHDTLLGSQSATLIGGPGKNKLVQPLPPITLAPPVAIDPGIINQTRNPVPNIFLPNPIGPAQWSPPAPVQADARIDGSTLVIRGTNNSDVITIQETDAFVSVNLNGSEHTFIRSAIAAVSITAADGDDLIDGSNCALPALVWAGNGKDTIITGSGDDSIMGEAGEDHRHGGAGNATIVGGADSDQFWGDDGDDVLDSIDGLDDTLHGGDGYDSNNTYADTADGIESRPLPPQPVCACTSLDGTTSVSGSMSFDDTILTRVDGLNVFRNTSWTVTEPSAVLIGGWHSIELSQPTLNIDSNGSNIEVLQPPADPIPEPATTDATTPEPEPQPDPETI